VTPQEKRQWQTTWEDVVVKNEEKAKVNTKPAVRRKSTRKLAVRADVSASGSGARSRAGAEAGAVSLVPLGLGDIPSVGQTIASPSNSPWGATTVRRVTSNFVHTHTMPRQGKLLAKSVPLQRGMVVALRLPPLDDAVTQLQILTFGWVWGKIKYRAVVFRRRIGTTGSWGELETMGAAAFPDVLHCHVHTRTHTLIRNTFFSVKSHLYTSIILSYSSTVNTNKHLHTGR
jgi:hypothetical protein